MAMAPSTPHKGGAAQTNVDAPRLQLLVMALFFIIDGFGWSAKRSTLASI